MPLTHTDDEPASGRGVNLTRTEHAHGWNNRRPKSWDPSRRKSCIAGAAIGLSRFMKSSTQQNQQSKFFTSMAQASSTWGIPMSALRRAKAAGCPGFTWGRVDVQAFVKWFFARDVADDDRDWPTALKRAQTLREELRLELDHGRMVERSEILEATRTGMGELFSALDRVFVCELPPVLKGLDERSIASRAKGEIEHLKHRLRQRFLRIAGKAPTQKSR